MSTVTPHNNKNNKGGHRKEETNKQTDRQTKKRRKKVGQVYETKERTKPRKAKDKE